MGKAIRVFVIADFKDESPKSIRISQRMWVKGLIRAGCDVQRFSYRNILTQFNPFSGSTDDKQFLRNTSSQPFETMRYACGMFLFTK